MTNGSYTVKSKDIPITEAYIIGADGNMMINGEIIDAHTVRIDTCAFNPSNKLVLVSEEGRTVRMSDRKLGSYKYQPLWGRYVIDSYNFRSVSKRGKQRILAKL